jgi:hypothetical protein
VGTGIMGGMLAATLIGVFFTPLFYVLVMGLGRRKARPDATATGTPPDPMPAPQAEVPR